MTVQAAVPGIKSVTLQTLPYIGKRLVFEIVLPGGRAVYLKHDPASSQEAVLVEARAFLSLWRASPYSGHAHLAMGNPTTWRNDYKFAQAEEGFRAGAMNPVPIPNISTYSRPAEAPRKQARAGFWKRLVSHAMGQRDPEQVERAQEHRSISVSDCTRTIWLLAHEAPWIPVLVNSRSANELRAWGVSRPAG